MKKLASLLTIKGLVPPYAIKASLAVDRKRVAWMVGDFVTYLFL